MWKGHFGERSTPIIDAAIGGDRLFEALERASEKNRKIIVIGIMRDFLTEQVLMRFVDRYK